MERILLALTKLFSRTPNFILHYKRQVLAVLLVISAFLFYGIFSLTVFDMSSDSFLEDENPAQIALDEFRRQFGGDDSVFIIYAAKDGDVFSRESLTAIQNLTQDLVDWEDLDRSDYGDVPWDELSHIRRSNLLGIFEYKRALEIP